MIRPKIKPDIENIESQGILRLKGIVVDEVIWVSSERFPMSVNQLQTNLRFDLFQWIRDVTSQLPSQTHRAIWSVMIANSHKLPLPQEYLEKLTDKAMRKMIDDVFESVLERTWSPDKKFQVVIESFIHCFFQATRIKRIFQTKDNRLGLGPIEVKQGDRVAVFMGAETAFFIRKVDSASSEPLSYRVVGESYVYELMEDENLKKSAVAEDILLK
jgi:hypothetical protein